MSEHRDEQDAPLPDDARALILEVPDGRLYCAAVTFTEDSITPLPGYQWEWLPAEPLGAETP